MTDFDDSTVLHSGGIDTDDDTGVRDQAYLIVLVGANVGEMYKLADAPTVIGRSLESDLKLLDDGISRQHARIVVRDDGTILLEDLESRNGTFVNGNRVGSPQALHDGDKIQIGSTTILKFTYHDRLDEMFQRQMYDSALRDGLTKAFNKKYFLDRLDAEFRFAARHSTPFALLMVDLDHFKRINDTHGHLAGDHVLAEVARMIQDTVRVEDVFARYGGEEFAVICRATAASQAMLLAERLRTTIANLTLRHGGEQIPVTISIGVAGYPEVPVTSAVELIAVADAALYAAKHGGRNCVRKSDRGAR